MASLDFQVGALIKEALRYTQAEMTQEFYAGEGMTDETEKLLSEFVSTILYQTPVTRNDTLGGVMARHKKSPMTATDFTATNQEYQKICADFARQTQMSCDAAHLDSYPDVESIEKMISV